VARSHFGSGSAQNWAKRGVNGYNLDPLGNWKSKTSDMVTQTRTHGPSNEIASVDAMPVLSDFNGNTH